jgi:hypothetical protein
MNEKTTVELEEEIETYCKEIKSLKDKGKNWEAFPIALLLDVLERDLQKRKEREK